MADAMAFFIGKMSKKGEMMNRLRAPPTAADRKKQQKILAKG